MRQFDAGLSSHEGELRPLPSGLVGRIAIDASGSWREGEDVRWTKRTRIGCRPHCQFLTYEAIEQSYRAIYRYLIDDMESSMFHKPFGLHSHGGRGRHGEKGPRGGRRGGAELGDASLGGGRRMFGRGGGGGGRGRVFGPGDLRLLLLALIEDKRRHGYELIKELEEKFGGAYAPSPGSVYPTLTLLEELGHVRSTTSEGTKRLYEITAEGRRYLRENESALTSVKKRMEMAARLVSGGMPPPEVHHAMHTLRAALMLRGRWDAAETERVSKIIEKAAADIFGAGDE